MTNETMLERIEDNITVMLYGLPQEWNKVEKEYGSHDADYGVLGLKGKEIAAYVLKEISQAIEKEREDIIETLKNMREPNLSVAREKGSEFTTPRMYRAFGSDDCIIEIIDAIKNK